jgi:hypothetical protein
MDRTGSDDHQQAFAVLAVQNATNSISRFNDQSGGLVGNRQLGLYDPRRGERLDFYDVLVIEWSLHNAAFSPGNRLYLYIV